MSHDTPRVYPLRIYDFLIDPIKEQDQKVGDKFVERYLVGPQNVWNTTASRIQEIPDLWSVVDIEDAFVSFLQGIVGWTGPAATLIDDLDTATKRKLIQSSIQLWKNRGPEDAIEDLIQLIEPTRLRILNWFDFRWLSGETELGEEHAGLDAWLINEQPDQYISNLRIVPALLPRVVIIEVLKVMKAVGERWEVAYINFLDLFTTVGDDTQWSTATLGTGSDVSAGNFNLIDDTQEEAPHITVSPASTWTEYVFQARILGTGDAAGEHWGLMFYFQDIDNHYNIVFDLPGDIIRLRKRVATVDSDIATAPIGEDLLPSGIFWTIRVVIVGEGATNRIKAYIDNVEIFNTTDSQFSSGSAGLIHAVGATLKCDDAELFQLPLDVNFLDINGVVT